MCLFSNKFSQKKAEKKQKRNKNEENCKNNKNGMKFSFRILYYNNFFCAG